jgi:hypothetical protein
MQFEIVVYSKIQGNTSMKILKMEMKRFFIIFSIARNLRVRYMRISSICSIMTAPMNEEMSRAAITNKETCTILDVYILNCSGTLFSI